MEPVLCGEVKTLHDAWRHSPTAVISGNFSCSCVARAGSVPSHCVIEKYGFLVGTFLYCVVQARAGAARLAAAQHSAPAEERAPPRHPGLLCLFGRALLSTEWPKARLEELLYHAYAAPWLQALLLALQGDTCASIARLFSFSHRLGLRRNAGRQLPDVWVGAC